MKKKFDILMEERENKIETLETIDSIIRNMQNQTIELMDNQLQIMDNIQGNDIVYQATNKKINKKDGNFEFSLEENGVSVGHEKIGMNLLMIKFKVCLNFTLIAFINVYADVIKIVIKDREQAKLAFELNRQASKFKNFSNEIRSISAAKRELQTIRDKLDQEIDEVTDSLILMIQNQ